MDLEELDDLASNFSFNCTKYSDRTLLIGQIVLQTKSLVINTTNRILEAMMELGNMEDIMNFWER